MYKISFVSDAFTDLISEFPFIQLYYTLPSPVVEDDNNDNKKMNIELDKEIREYIEEVFMDIDGETCEVMEPGTYYLASDFAYDDWANFLPHIENLSKAFPEVCFILTYTYGKGYIPKTFIMNGFCYEDTSLAYEYDFEKLGMETEITTYTVED